MRGKAIWHEEAKSFQQIELQIRGTALKDLRRHGFSLSRAERVLPASDGGLGSHRSPPSVSPSSSSGGTMIFWVAKKSVMGVHNFFFRSWMVERGIPTVRETFRTGMPAAIPSNERKALPIGAGVFARRVFLVTNSRARPEQGSWLGPCLGEHPRSQP